MGKIPISKLQNIHKTEYYRARVPDHSQSCLQPVFVNKILLEHSTPIHLCIIWCCFHRIRECWVVLTSSDRNLKYSPCSPYKESFPPLIWRYELQRSYIRRLGPFPAEKFISGAVIVCLVCYNKVACAPWLANNKLFFLTVLEAGKS